MPRNIVWKGKHVKKFFEPFAKDAASIGKSRLTVKVFAAVCRIF